jgi:hypothetical protein
VGARSRKLLTPVVPEKGYSVKKSPYTILIVKIDLALILFALIALIDLLF